MGGCPGILGNKYDLFFPPVCPSTDWRAVGKIETWMSSPEVSSWHLACPTHGDPHIHKSVEGPPTTSFWGQQPVSMRVFHGHSVIFTAAMTDKSAHFTKQKSTHWLSHSSIPWRSSCSTGSSGPSASDSPRPTPFWVGPSSFPEVLTMNPPPSSLKLAPKFSSWGF